MRSLLSLMITILTQVSYYLILVLVYISKKGMIFWYRSLLCLFHATIILLLLDQQPNLPLPPPHTHLLESTLGSDDIRLQQDS